VLGNNLTITNLKENFMKKLIVGIMILASNFSFAADSGLNPNYIKIKVYKFAVSRSEYCTNPKVVLTNENPEYEDILSSPTFGTGSIKNGTYKCVMLEISDIIKFSPDQNSDSGGCLMGIENTLDICREETTKTLAGETVGCIVGEDRVVIYLSTATIESEMFEENFSAFLPPLASEKRYGVKLHGALKVTKASSGTLVVNGLGQVSDIVNDAERKCELDAPVFSFR